jgi:phenylacetate-CoA ligase
VFVGGPEFDKALNISTELANIISYGREYISAYKDFPDADTIKTLGNFQQLPLVNEDQLARAPEDFVSRQARIFRLSTSGGTTRLPKILYRTYRDHLSSSRVAAEMFKTSTISPIDTVAILHPFDIWGIGFIALEALRFMHAAAFPVGSALSDEQCLHWFAKIQPSIIYATPSRASTIAALTVETHRRRRNWAPRALLLAGEPITYHLRHKLETVFDAEVFSIYGSEETDGLAAECCSHAGVHLMEKGIIYELLDPTTLIPTDSNRGILIVTPLGWRGTVLIRYVTGDIVELDFAPCKCGKPTPRIVNIQRLSEGAYLWDALYITDSQISKAIEKALGGAFSYQCIIKGVKPPQVLQVLIDIPREISRNRRTMVKLRHMIIDSSVDLASACNAREVRVIVEPLSINGFQKTKRGKTPQFLFKD